MKEKFCLLILLSLNFITEAHTPASSSEEEDFINCADSNDNLANKIAEYIKNGINVNADRNGNTALRFACNNGTIKIVNELLKSNQIDVNKPDRDGRTPLMFAADNNKIDATKQLLSMPELKINALDKYGWSALALAVDNGFSEIVDLLLCRSDININLSTNYRWTPLMFAIDNNRVEIVFKLLARSDIDLSKKNCLGSDACSMAKEKNESIYNCILEKMRKNYESQ